MWSKRKLEMFVILSIFTSAVLTTLRVLVFRRHGAGSLLMVASSLAKTMISYSKTHKFGFGIENVFFVSGFSFIGTLLGIFAYYCNASSTSYVISSNLQYLFVAFVSTVWCGVNYQFTQHIGLLIILLGFLVEVSLADTYSKIPVHLYIGLLSGMFNAVSYVVFDSKVKPLLADFKSFWDYMTAYGIYLTVFSSLHMVQEINHKRAGYLEVLKSPTVYSALILEIVVTYLLSRVSLFLDSTERATLFNISSGVSAVTSDLYLSHEIDIQRFLGFSFVIIGSQLFIFFGRKG